MEEIMGGSGPGLTLDDAAALLVQLGPGDPDLLRLRTVLEDLALAGGMVPAAQARIAGAARRVAEAAAADEEAASALLQEAGRLIEEAMRADEELRSPATEPLPAPAPRSDALPAAEVDLSLLPDFIAESREYMRGAEAALLALEADPGDAEAVNTVFRAFHTIKGTSAFLGLQPIGELAHLAESLFNRFRDGEIRCTGPRADVSLRSVDMLTALLDAAEGLLSGGGLLVPDGYEDLLGVLRDPAEAGLLDGDDEAAMRLGDLLVAGGKACRADVETVVGGAGAEPLGISLVRAKAASLTDVAQALRKQQRGSAAADGGGDPTVRVRTDRLDGLVDLVGELVVAHSMVAQDPAITANGYSELARKVAQAGKIVRELQDLSVSMRMVPLAVTFQKMSRLVRDVARRSGKRVQFVGEGAETEIDRNLVDIVGDPLVHMIRNAIDHGIEAPEVRALAGKPEAGTVRLSAYHGGGNVVIELCDDGRGMDRDRIVEKALARGLIDSGRGLSDADVFRLILAPGFSTAEEVTDLSGRGVGMDVVKRNIESVGGRIEIASAAGAGSNFVIRLPLTLAVTDGMLVRVSDERYILPTTNIQMSFRPRREMLSTVAGRGEMVLLRDELLPIVRLHRLFEIAGAALDPTEALLVVVGSGEHRCALLVDEVLGQQQVVAKSLGQGVAKVPGVAGGAVLGDGRIGLILDVAEIVALFQRRAA